MSVLFKAPRGTVDILPQEAKIWQNVRIVALKICKKFGFSEIILPTFENKNLFTKSNDETSDIVQKEMFCFKDLGGRELALRPEITDRKPVDIRNSTSLELNFLEANSQPQNLK